MSSEANSSSKRAKNKQLKASGGGEQSASSSSSSSVSVHVGKSNLKVEDDDEMKIQECPSSHDSSSVYSEEKEDEDEENESEAESSEFDEDSNLSSKETVMKKMQSIEENFTYVNNKLYDEKRRQINYKLEQVRQETSRDYLLGVQQIDDEQKQKLKVIELKGSHHNTMLNTLYEADKWSSAQQLQNDKKQLIEGLQSEIYGKYFRLSDERDNVDNSVEKFTDTNGGSYDSKGRRVSSSKNSNQKIPKRKKKPVTVTGPYIVYMLREEEIANDIAQIKKAVSYNQRQVAIRKRQKITHTCRCENKRLNYGGRVFSIGEKVAIRSVMDDSAVIAKIVAVNNRELFVHQNNGINSKIYFHQLQRGRITLHLPHESC